MHHLKPDQIDAVCSHLDPSMKVIVRIAFNHGLRISEAVYLRPSNFDMRGGFITVQRLKGSLKTTQPLFPQERAAVAPFLAGKAPNDRLFLGLTRFSAYHRFRKAVLAAGLPAHLAHPHVLKHSTGMLTISAGIHNCCRYLGHKNISSTGAYLKVSDEAASAAVANLF